MKSEKLVAAVASTLAIGLIIVCSMQVWAKQENCWWAMILLIFILPIAAFGYLFEFLVVDNISQRLKMDGFVFSFLTSALLGSMVFGVASGFGFFGAFSRGQFKPRLYNWKLELVLLLLGAMGGAVGGIVYYLTKKMLAPKSSRSGRVKAAGGVPLRPL